MAPGQLARLVMARAVLRLHEGDPAAAVESTFAAVKLRRIFGWTPLVSHMTRIACLHMAARSGGLLATSPDVSEADLQRLMALLEEADEPESVRRALLGERVVGMAMLGITPGAQRLPGAAPGALPPLARGMVAGMYMRFMAESLEAAEQPFPQVLDAITQVRGRGLYKSLAPAGFPGVAMSTARTDALLRAARVAIACELYRREHGQPPEALSDLVPAFVPAVPLDPFDGRPLRYQRAGRTVLLYSVDENRTDDGGAIEAPSGHEPVDRGLRLTLP